MFFGKKNQKIDGFAQNMADDLYSQLPPENAHLYVFEADSSEKISQKIKNDAIRKMNEKIVLFQQFKKANKLGLYGKARLHMKFTERLKELGYAESVAEELNKAIMLRSI